MRLHPETGRTHQIRVHLAALGHPIVGDRVYGRGHDSRALGMTRQALHAEAIRFRHPITERSTRIAAPLAADFAAALRCVAGASLDIT